MQPFIGICTDVAAYGRAAGAVAEQERARRAARLRPLPERVAEAMQEIASVRGSCDREDLDLRFPGEELTEAVLAAAKKLAGRRSTARVA